MASHLAWRDVNLNDTTTPFNTDYIYRMYSDGWLMPVIVTSTVLYFLPSTHNRLYGCVHYFHKSEWDYRIIGDCAKRPPEYPGYIAPVGRLQYLVVENDNAPGAYNPSLQEKK
jgi:hypothetical protein